MRQIEEEKRQEVREAIEEGTLQLEESQERPISSRSIAKQEVEGEGTSGETGAGLGDEGEGGEFGGDGGVG